MEPTKAEIALQRKTLGESPIRTGFFWEAHKDGLIVRAEFDIHGGEHKLAEMDGLQPFEFHARPYDTNRFQAIHVTIEAGMEPIWLHVVNHGINLFAAGQRVDSALIFGRLHPPNAFGVRIEEVALVLADGTVAGFNKIETAKTVFYDAVRAAQAFAG